jgi:preprotein translocase subunit SecA
VQKKGMADDEALTHRWLNKALETAQGKVEARNFEIRKNLLRFDDVMNSQRKEIYKERVELMATEDVSDVVAAMRRDVVDAMVSRAIPEDAYAEQWKITELKEDVQRVFGLDLPVDAWAKEEGIAEEQIKTRLNDAVDRLFAQRVAQYGPEVWRQVEKSVLMQLFDQNWKEHLLHLDHLRQGIGLRAYGQKDPLNEYKREAFNLFSDLLMGLREGVVNVLATLQLRMEAPPMPAEPAQMREVHEDPALAAALSSAPDYDPADPSPPRRGWRRRDARASGHQAGGRSQRSFDLGQGRTQRALPLRLRQEIQALPRPGVARRAFRSSVTASLRCAND